jgi:hypothetical protein
VDDTKEAAGVRTIEPWVWLCEGSATDPTKLDCSREREDWDMLETIEDNPGVCSGRTD